MPRLLVLDESVPGGLRGILTAFEVKAAPERELGRDLEREAPGSGGGGWKRWNGPKNFARGPDHQSLGYDQSRSRRDRSRVRRGRARDIHCRQPCPTAPAPTARAGYEL